MEIKKITPTAKIPTKGSKYAAGYDLYADNVIRSMVSFWYNGMRLFERDGEVVVGNSQNGTTDITLVLDSPLSTQDKFYVEVVKQGV